MIDAVVAWLAIFVALPATIVAWFAERAAHYAQCAAIELWEDLWLTR